MVRRLLSWVVLAAACAGAMAQSLNVHLGNVTYSYPYDETTSMVYSTNVLSINGEDYELSQVTSITGSAEKIDPSQVYVAYDGASANVVMSGELRGRVTATFNGANVTLTDNAVIEEGALPTIPEVTYHLSGTSTDGSFTQQGSYKCGISLEGVSLQSSACPMQIENGKRIDIILADGTQNTFQDGSNNFRKSAFYVKGHAEFTGAGTLNINGTQRHAYSSNEYTLLKQTFTGAINIVGAASDGMHVDQYYEQRGGAVKFENVVGDNLDVASTLDAADEFNGQIIISGGSLTCRTNSDDTKCIKSETSMTIKGGKIFLTCPTDGSKGLSVGTDLLVEQDVNAGDNESPYIYIFASGDTYEDPSTLDTSKCRGIKVKGNFTFAGGTIERDANSLVKSTKIISIDGTYTYQKGVLKNCLIQ